MEEYQTLKEKSNFFNHQVINSPKELEGIINKYCNNHEYRFRGVKEAKYKMFTSLQREFPNSMKGKDHISQMLVEINKNKNINNYFKENNIKISDISCLALMQHTGLPTPFLDFTTDMTVALSFAANEINLSSSKQDINDYVSLYLFSMNEEKELAQANLQQIYSDALENASELIAEYKKNTKKAVVDTSIICDIAKFTNWNEIKDMEFLYIEYQGLARKVITQTGQSLNISNPNSEKQKGCFIFYLCDNTPLEKTWNNRLCNYHSRINGVKTFNKISCFDIKKQIMNEWANKNSSIINDIYDTSESFKFITKELKAIKSKIV